MSQPVSNNLESLSKDISIEEVDDRFAEKTTQHIRDLALRSNAIKKMYFYDGERENLRADRDRDLFYEKQFTQTKGLVSKYDGRVLVLLSYTCAANCRYCERQDRVGVGLDLEGRLSTSDIDAAVEFVRNDPSIFEVIFSGGDPLTHPKGLVYAAEKFANIPHVKMLRIHTRFPIQFPEKMSKSLVASLARLDKIVYFSLHVDHPDELTKGVLENIRFLRESGLILLCQSVFLKGVNDDFETLFDLFLTLYQHGVRPYYLYHCQAIPTTMSFVMEIEDEVAIMTALREKLSGAAVPQHVIELQHATGKLIAPTNHWNTDWGSIIDFNGVTHSLKEKTMFVQKYSPPLE